MPWGGELVKGGRVRLEPLFKNRNTWNAIWCRTAAGRTGRHRNENRCRCPPATSRTENMCAVLSYGRPSLWVIVSGNLTEALPAQLLEINVPHRALFPIDPLSCVHVHLMCPLRKLRRRLFFALSRVFRSLCCRFIECSRTVAFVSCFLLSKLHDSSFSLTSFYNIYFNNLFM